MSLRWYLGRLAAALLIGGVTAGSLAVAQQRDPAYAAARSAGQIGEKMDGYLGFVVPPSADVKRLVEDLNIKRKAVYAQQAQAQHATVEEYALTAGCLAISRTVSGEKYQAPDGSWATRGAGPPQRDARCP
ncbi:YdbL family protein [Novosphingobium flavum]|uniref:YdbL family protein n=1 Tax=Novosphingobium flavum TaxID=1778672 RepID=A0A7X1FSK2_9SPHN|nr:YdbL family protein [Novosphingobium flavum]MBC2666214.1 YdbL family protein [Novosphingobium flavum]